jgi:hypothetical protein
MAFFALVLLMSGCLSQNQNTGQKSDLIKCSPPYLRVGAECCLDQDDNKICDRDETTSTMPTTTEPTTTTQPETTTTKQPTTSSTLLAELTEATTTVPATYATTLAVTTITEPPATSTTTTTLPLPCTDTDGGADENVKGTLKRGGEILIDHCIGPASLQEYFCQPNNRTGTKIVECAQGCEEGRCLGCLDTDGGDNPSVYGQVTLGKTLVKKDLCSRIGNGTTLQEYFCKSKNEVGSRMVDCMAGCVDGRCN